MHDARKAQINFCAFYCGGPGGARFCIIDL